MVSNLEYYRTFFYVASTGSFSGAANALCVSQSAVSQSVRKLEAELGCTLFERTTRQLHLTAAGRALFERVRDSAQSLFEGEQAVSRILETQSRQLSIGATETSVRYYLPDILRSFSEKHPQVRITFTGTTTEDLCRMLSEGRIELALLISPVPADPSFDLVPLWEFQDLPVAASASPWAASDALTPEQLAAKPLITVSAKNQVRRLFDEWFIREGQLLAPSCTVQTMSQVLPLVYAGLGIGFVPEMAAAEGIEKGDLSVVPTTSLPPKRIVYLATSGKENLSDAAVSFIREITA